jgi:hypothetical protein
LMAVDDPPGSTVSAIAGRTPKVLAMTAVPIRAPTKGTTTFDAVTSALPYLFVATAL